MKNTAVNIFQLLKGETGITAKHYMNIDVVNQSYKKGVILTTLHIS